MIQFVVKLSLYLSSGENMIDLFVSIIIVSFSFTLYIYISSVHRGGKFLKFLKFKKWLLVSLSSFWACRRKSGFQRAFFLNYCFKSIWKSQAKAAIPTFPRNSNEAFRILTYCSFKGGLTSWCSRQNAWLYSLLGSSELKSQLLSSFASHLLSFLIIYQFMY